MKVSIITPSWNQGQFIERTLQSVAMQTGGEIEHVVLDGGSTDDTIQVLKRFGSGIRWVSEPDRGQAHAVNKGIQSTNGGIIGWLNSDDLYYLGAVARVVDFFLSHPEMDVVYGMADHIDKQDYAFAPYPTEQWNYDRLQETCFICQPALFLRRRVIERHGLLDESLKYCMDYEYWLRIGKAGVRFAYIKEKLAGSRLYIENKTLGNRLKVHWEINDMLQKQLGRVPDRWIFNYANATMGHRIGDPDHMPIITALEIWFRAVLAALKWNGRISRTMACGVYKLFFRQIT